MSLANYIRPMSFRETLGTMFRLYWKVFIPIIVMNIIVNVITFSTFTFIGLLVGPVLIMTSNVMLGQRVKVWQSIRKGVSLGLVFKMALVSIVFLGVIVLLAMVVGGVIGGIAGSDKVGYAVGIIIYALLSPLWIFIPMIMLLEKQGLRASIQRSFQILKKNFIRVAQMDIFINLVLAVMSILLYLLVNDPTQDFFTNFTVGVGFAMLIAAITGFNAIPFVFVYYEFRARFENYSDALLTEELGYQPIEEMMTI
jgi:hypothetical protein